MSDSLQCVFLTLEIERRSLVAATLKPTKTTRDTEAVEIKDQMLYKPFNAVGADLYEPVCRVMRSHSWSSLKSPMHQL